MHNANERHAMNIQRSASFHFVSVIETKTVKFIQSIQRTLYVLTLEGKEGNEERNKVKQTEVNQYDNFNCGFLKKI